MLLRAVHRRRIVVPAWVRYATGTVALTLAAFGVGQAVRVPPVKEVEIAIKGLPREFDGFRLVQLTDLHISRLFQVPWVEALVRETNALNPDLIVITGDLIDGWIEDRRHDVQPLGGLRADLGTKHLGHLHYRLLSPARRQDDGLAESFQHAAFVRRAGIGDVEGGTVVDGGPDHRQAHGAINALLNAHDLDGRAKRQVDL